MGNKCDLEDDRLVPTEDGRRLADELGEHPPPPVGHLSPPTELLLKYALEPVTPFALLILAEGVSLISLCLIYRTDENGTGTGECDTK